MIGFAKCGHCGGSGTKISEISPTGAAYKQNAICCTSCNAILGVTGYYDTGAMIKKQEAEIQKLKQTVDQLDYNLRQVM
jgi:hypothetical protein